jgi:hypothetical protein
MTQLLFYKGHDTTPQGAVGQALHQCGEILMSNPSLVVQLENLYSTGDSWDADIRVMALAEEKTAYGGKRKGRHHRYEIKNPEHLKSGNPNEWRPVGMQHDAQPVAFRFGNAAIAGELPDIPIQEIAVPGYDPVYSTEFDLKRLLLEHETHRLKTLEKLENDLD